MDNIAFIFPGQGSQYTGMGKEICNNFEIAKQTFSEASDIVGFDLLKLCTDGDAKELIKTENAQPAILTTSVAIFRVLKEIIDLNPKFGAGHSLGEYSALTCAGAIEFKDAVRLVKNRGKFMQKAVPVGAGLMAAVMGVSQDKIIHFCKNYSSQGKTVVPANINSNEQIIISGDAEGVKHVAGILESQGAITKVLNVSAPFHSPLMQPAADKMRKELLDINYGDMDWPIIANLNAQPYVDKESIQNGLVTQIVQPVLWKDTMMYLVNQGIDHVIEIGPKTVLKDLFKESYPLVKGFSLESKEEILFMKGFVKGFNEDDLFAEAEKKCLSGLDFLKECLVIAASTKNNNFDSQSYYKDVIVPYLQLKNLKEDIEEKGIYPTFAELKKAHEFLKLICQGKYISIKEQEERFKKLLSIISLAESVVRN